MSRRSIWWNPYRIEQTLRERLAAGQSISQADLDPRLVEAAAQYYPSWEAVLAAAENSAP